MLTTTSTKAPMPPGLGVMSAVELLAPLASATESDTATPMGSGRSMIESWIDPTLAPGPDLPAVATDTTPRTRP